MNPKCAKNPADKQAREKLAKKIGAKLLQGNQIQTSAIYPALGERWGRPAGSGIALTIPENCFRRVTEKIVRGITYMEDTRFIELPHRIHFYALDSDGSRPLLEAMKLGGTTLAREPGIIVRRVVAPEDGVSALYEIEFWKQFKTHAAVVEQGYSVAGDCYRES